MDLGRSVAFPFQSPAWLGRVLVGGVLEVVPMLLVLPLLPMLLATRRGLQPHHLLLLGLAGLVGLLARLVLLGYLRRMAAAILDGTAENLPAWDRFGDDIVEGFRVWLIALAIWLPAIAIVIALALLGSALGPTASWLPVALVGPPIVLATLAVMPAALLAAIERGSVVAAFDFEAITARMKQVAGAYVLAFAFAAAVEIIAQAGLLLACIGIFFTRFIAHAMAVHAFASAWRKSR